MTIQKSVGLTRHVLLDRRVIENALKDRSGRTILADTACKGLRLTIWPKSATYSYAYRPRGVAEGGKRHPQRTIALGYMSTLTPAEARVRAESIKEAVRRGEDPATDHRRAAAAAAMGARRAKPLGELAKDYIGDRLTAGTKHHREEAIHLRLALSDMSASAALASDIRIADIAALVKMHANRPATAQHRLGALSRLFDHLTELEIVPVNPAKALGRKSRPKAPPPRNRVLTAVEVQAIWNATTDIAPVRADFVRAMLAVPLRRGEMAELRVGDVNLGTGTITLPGTKTKNGDDFAIAIPACVASIFERRCKGMASEARVFQLSSSGGPMTAWSSLIESVSTKSGVEFGLHDIRRTFVSELAEHEIGDATLADGLLNHRQSETRGGVKAAYHHAKLDNPRRRMMENWGRVLHHAISKGEWPRQNRVEAGQYVHEGV